ncbi:hypothetical protein N6H18_05760 [Reichenbachiella agarivorans]|uniref:GAF domain-containing protein n=1 Tax=Reichenbachiella agarivorans TaxID=2979464 RepID=A0ABY6CSF7_9BACT|nr:hypothetical protein [Reichenbachiella agarivorans]UXP33457.1 hypothetical protein N6H18_05760 [Reichenbachiella agarivorans]
MGESINYSNPLQFPFESKLSLANLILYWQVRMHSTDSFVSSQAAAIIAEVEKISELQKPITDLSLLEKHKSVIRLLMSAIFSPYTEEEEMIGVLSPFAGEIVYASKAYQDIMLLVNKEKNNLPKNREAEIMTHNVMGAYSSILDLFYNVSVDRRKDIFHTLQNSETGLNKYYKISINTSFCEIIPKGDLPVVDDQVVKLLLSNSNSPEIWMEMLPPHLFRFQGFVIVRLHDVSNEEVLSRIKEGLLERSSITNEESFEKLQSRFKDLLQISDLKLGITGFDKTKGTFVNFGKQNNRSIILGSERTISCHITSDKLCDLFTTAKEPIVIDEDSSYYQMMDQHAKRFSQSGIKSLIMSPLFYNDEFVGILELGFKDKIQLSSAAISYIKEVLPLFAIAVKRDLEDVQNKISTIIKKKYTSIHPTVEWKFSEMANLMLDQINVGLNPVTPPIVFENVYPLYAASDIRNSSVVRNDAINRDLLKQIKLARNVLEKALELTNLPILEETLFQLNDFREKIKDQLITGDEHAILDYIKYEVEPIIQSLDTNHTDIKKHSDQYWAALDVTFGVVYESRKKFEFSLNKINETIIDILDHEEQRAQKMFPHFFERYRSDGVEHNIYIGKSLVDKQEYDEIYLRNLRLWQLLVTAEIANKTARLMPELPLPLETTHLVLVHSNPLSIRFRQDEKKFDVDGAYNIRYEIIKKRIDKARVKNSNERITQPGKISIIYAQEKDVQEYSKYISYMMRKGLLIGEIEYLDLEELQGVSGLKALRVAVNYESFSVMDEVKKILQET